MKGIWLAPLSALVLGFAMTATQAEENDEQRAEVDAPDGYLVITEEMWLPVLAQPSLTLERARESFVRRDYDEAADDIAAAAAFLRIEAERVGRPAEEELGQVADRLEDLAERVRDEDVHDLNELGSLAAETNHALAERYHELAEAAEDEGESRHAGYYLRAAAHHLEHAFAWTGHEIDEGSRDAIDAVKDGADDVARGAEWTGDEARDLFSRMGDEVDQARDDIAQYAREREAQDEERAEAEQD
ncbi:hypothetical protein CAI21_19220 [Alkalilimnicola ehrlichii]|uniref:DUF5667 domain-containing protein n=2 Tax=Alkalilimnicola ehrlichii TaxID=351052 RepID=A0A3E0WKT6_9GAMM|nr:hypothetical protein [Alkalilimnicola ehrlichii]RFA25368.1 hypothetical protein CAI21_19220 [Alkalilimnicola ehrlichii]RFA32545.1 hypothetical protein CAL65_19485 [Alkalilimnicola ehrlichii]